MADYKRLVSYIYSYSGGVRDKNVGFAKAEVRNGQFKLAVSLKGVYTDTPEVFGVYFMVDKEKSQTGAFSLLKIGTVMVNQGIGQYQDILNPSNINQSQYTFDEVSGIAVAREDNRFYMMFSLWEDCALDSSAVKFLEDGYKKPGAERVPEETAELKETEEAEEELSEQSQSIREVEAEILKACQAADEDTVTCEPEEADLAQEIKVMESTIPEKVQPCKKDGFEAVFDNADFIDAFDDDYYYDCVEVSPETLKKLPIEDEAVINNSFLVHGYFNFRHILFGRVRENDNNTRYFIGVPGMYCNRERFMASMFGFNNFKKSHRSDYTNPYFGYWYQEI
ncbi:MAG: hypothetical protein J5981_06335 [Lachnospira sp.]|nr:hypothetical protein [Lachnospira sp.]